MKAVLVIVVLTLLQGRHAQDAGAGDTVLPHVDSCNYCAKCTLDGEPPVEYKLAVPRAPPSLQPQPLGGAAAESPPPPAQAPLSPYAQPLQPPDPEAKALLPNCTVCRGCNVELDDISARQVAFQNVRFQHGKGATNGRIFFARLPNSGQRFVLKVFCIPISKLRWRANKVATCSVRQAGERVEVLLAQQKLLAECGMQEISPRVWLANVNAVLPDSGYHVRWHGLWMEEAHGITLHGLYASRDQRLALQLLQHRLNRTQVQLGAIWDLLTSQCDRHSENIFIDERGNLQYIDNDKALGVVTKCGYDTMLLPGTRYHSVIRIGFWRQLAEHYRQQRQKNPGFCHGMVDSRFVMDYRCTTPSGTLGKSYPPNVERCASKLSFLSVEEIMAEYGLSNPARAETLKARATDMLAHGFEWTMENGHPLNSPRYRMPQQPACCGLTVVNRMISCDKCWQPLLPEDFSNSSDLSLVTSLLDPGKQRRVRHHLQETVVQRETVVVTG